MKILTISNQKGGVAKTTTAAALWAGLNMRGFKTLAIDLDPQRNLSDGVGADESKTAFGVLTGEVTAAEAVQTVGGFDIIAGAGMLAAAESVLTETGKECRLKEALEPLKKKYDYCIIDTPPSLNVLTVNALTATDGVIVPVQADLFSINGLTKLYLTVEAVRKYFNPGLQIEGVLLTKYKPRANMSREIMKILQDSAERLDTKIYKTAIRESIKAAEAPAQRQAVIQAFPRSTVAEDYNSLIDEITAERTPQDNEQ